MSTKPVILPLDAEGRFYALQDGKGNTIGTGTREVCEVLLYIINKAPTPSVSEKSKLSVPRRPNVRTAIPV